MQTNRYLLIKSLGKSIWADVDHVMCQILAAELTNRIPVVYWGMESLYSESISTNAYEFFFEPVSAVTIHDIVRPGYTFSRLHGTRKIFIRKTPTGSKWKTGT